MNPDVFKAKLALMLSAIRESARPDLHPAVVLMTWLKRDDDPNSSSAVWFPDEPAAFTLGLDPYDICGCNPFRSWSNRRSHCGETPVASTGGQRDRYQADRRCRRGMDRRDVRLLPLRRQLRRADVVPQRGSARSATGGWTIRRCRPPSAPNSRPAEPGTCAWRHAGARCVLVPPACLRAARIPPGPALHVVDGWSVTDT